MASHPCRNALVLLHVQVAVQSFKLAWNFTDGESISGGANVSAPFVADTVAGHQVGHAPVPMLTSATCIWCTACSGDMQVDLLDNCCRSSQSASA